MEARGLVNCYTEFRAKVPVSAKKIWTLNLTNGVTPFMLVVDGVEYSSEMYRMRGERIVVSQVWYRPLVQEFEKLDPSVQDHVLNGGLLHTADFGIRSYTELVPDDFETCQQVFLSLYGKRKP